MMKKLNILEVNRLTVVDHVHASSSGSLHNTTLNVHHLILSPGVFCYKEINILSVLFAQRAQMTYFCTAYEA